MDNMMLDSVAAERIFQTLRTNFTMYDMEGVVKWVIASQLPLAFTFTHESVRNMEASILESLGKENYLKMRNVFKAAFILMVSSSNSNQPQLVPNVEQFLSLYPEFYAASREEREVLFQYRNLLVMAGRVFDPMRKRADMLMLIEMMCGISSGPLTCRQSRRRREMIYKRETGVIARYRRRPLKKEFINGGASADSNNFGYSTLYQNHTSNHTNHTSNNGTLVLPNYGDSCEEESESDAEPTLHKNGNNHPLTNDGSSTFPRVYMKDNNSNSSNQCNASTLKVSEFQKGLKRYTESSCADTSAAKTLKTTHHNNNNNHNPIKTSSIITTALTTTTLPHPSTVDYSSTTNYKIELGLMHRKTPCENKRVSAPAPRVQIPPISTLSLPPYVSNIPSYPATQLSNYHTLYSSLSPVPLPLPTQSTTPYPHTYPLHAHAHTSTHLPSTPFMQQPMYRDLANHLNIPYRYIHSICMPPPYFQASDNISAVKSSVRGELYNPANSSSNVATGADI